MMRVFIIMLFMAAMLRAQADNVVYGTVCDNDSVPLPGVIVKVVDGEDDIYAYCATDVNGYYELKYETQSAPLSVSFAFMGFQPVTIPL
ncbi:MAG: carboxypeptidase-like regulatory domain-containing protein, partial [Muribaculaceae bacterium]